MMETSKEQTQRLGLQFSFADQTPTISNQKEGGFDGIKWQLRGSKLRVSGRVFKGREGRGRFRPLKNFKT